jgi:two-component system chemotaxis response regulator CheB
MSHASPADSRVRVLVVDDSAFMRNALSRMIASEQGLAVVGTAASGNDALAIIESLDPDVVTLDIDMPGLDGLATLRCIMSRFPRPVIMVSAATEEHSEIALESMSAGAFACVHKRLSEESLDVIHIRTELIAKIQAAAESRLPRSPDSGAKKPPAPASLEHSAAAFTPAVVAIAASTGGPTALQHILSRFPRDFELPILIVQHMPPGGSAFAQHLKAASAIQVREASEGEQLFPGVAYVAASGRHMAVARRTSGAHIIVYHDSQSRDTLYIPSADVLLESVAEVFGAHSLGVVLTGMGGDGVKGITAIYRCGGFTIGQDEASCTVYGTPRTCAQRGVLSQVAPLGAIVPEILRLTRRCKRA